MLREPSAGTRALLHAIRAVLTPLDEEALDQPDTTLGAWLEALAEAAEVQRLGGGTIRAGGDAHAAGGGDKLPGEGYGTEGEALTPQQVAALRAELQSLREAAFAAAEGQAMASARRAAQADSDLEQLRADLAAAKARSDELEWRLKAMPAAQVMVPADAATPRQSRVMLGNALNAVVGYAVACAAPRHKGSGSHPTSSVPPQPGSASAFN